MPSFLAGQKQRSCGIKQTSLYGHHITTPLLDVHVQATLLLHTLATIQKAVTRLPRASTFLHWSRSLTVMFPVPGPTSNTTSVGRRAAWREKGEGNVITYVITCGPRVQNIKAKVCVNVCLMRVYTYVCVCRTLVGV